MINNLLMLFDCNSYINVCAFMILLELFFIVLFSGFNSNFSSLFISIDQCFIKLVNSIFLYFQFIPSSDQILFYFFWLFGLCFPSRVHNAAGHLNRPWLWGDMRKCVCRVGSRHQRLQRCVCLCVFNQHVSSNNKSSAPLTSLIMFFVQRVLVWSIPWMGTCCGPWRAPTAACGLASSSPPPRETAWSTTTRDSSASSVSTANCWDTWRWRTASRWGNVSTHVKVHMCVCYTSAQRSRLTD